MSTTETDSASIASSIEDVAPQASAPPPPPSTAVPPPATAVAVPEEGERNAVFASLVTADNDVVGLIAYSIYKQNKHDWLVAFRRQRRRDPDDAEIAAYIIGEGTARRLATYRHLAAATLEGRGPEITFGKDADDARTRSVVARPPAKSGKAVGAAGWILLGVVVLVLIIVAARTGMYDRMMR